ncbi:hypothetical protein [Rubripirellula reticaptiva]|uniref:Peptidylprolyl isomerase n=1 Tax=Rubripirellula reticaptiva TaxID=2528013 RepID=A0A5C6F6T8_9BACT|nr:hypothetical protein [Rubripirellula reticaptiva]TWU55539.1 hypothetical protein Poly59_18390 [Rubripirellula reticaptiva]
MKIQSFLLAAAVCVSLAGETVAQDTAQQIVGGVAKDDIEPGDPYAAVQGEAIYVGEINLVLTQRISARDLVRVGEDVKRATALLLVRRHLAMNALMKLGGKSLADSLDRRVQSYSSEAKQRGTSIDELAKARQSTSEAMIADIRWSSAWAQYLKSKMTPDNLQRYFEAHRDEYGGGQFQDLADQSKLRRDAADALFENLVASESETKVTWFVDSLHQQDR